jgi:hypothetical protein
MNGGTFSPEIRRRRAHARANASHAITDRLLRFQPGWLNSPACFQHKDYPAQHVLAYYDRVTSKGGLSWLK